LIFKVSIYERSKFRGTFFCLAIFKSVCPRGGKNMNAKTNDLFLQALFLQALFYISAHGGSWRSLPERFGKWNSVYVRFNTLCKAQAMGFFFIKLREESQTSHLIVLIGILIIKVGGAGKGDKIAKCAQKNGGQ
jgi:transposase